MNIIVLGVFGEETERVVRQVLNEAIGLGPIQPLVEDGSISEVMVNAPNQVYFERDGMIYDGRAFPGRSAPHAHHRADRLAAWAGASTKHPMVDARLPDGSRVNAIIPPLALDGPS